MTTPAPQSSPAYLRTLAAKYDTTAADVTAPAPKRQAARRHATRLLEIAAELDHLYAGATPATTPPRDLTHGLDRKLADMRAAQGAVPTPAELAEIRAMVKGGPP